ncbi:MAG: ABC transporter permease [Saccharofermentans sp.]|nr:ABC transporter permease [Saccharofermentans sp.]
MTAIFKREFLSYFRSPVGYVAIAIFSFLSGFLFYSQFSGNGVNLSSEINSLRNFFVIIIPVITMGLFAEDKKRGTEVLYYTTPVNLFSVVMGKFLAASALFGVMFINVFIHMFVTKICGGSVGVGTWGSVIVFFFMAFMFISIGILASATTDSQIIAAIFGFIMILVIQLISTISTYFGNTVTTILGNLGVNSETAATIGSKITDGISWLDPFAKTQDFRFGVFSVSALMFCLSVTVIFLYLAFRVLEKKRWSQG